MMHTKMFLVSMTGLLVLASPLHAEDAVEPRSGDDAIVFGLDLFPYVGTSSALPDAPRVVSFNMVGGLSGGTRLFELGGAFNVTRGDVQGFQLGGAANINAGDRAGMQVAGALNTNGGDVSGLGVGGAANINAGSVEGLQVAGALNINGGDVSGLGVAGAANVNGGSVQGLQVAGALNLNPQAFEGAQVGGALNLTRGDVQGLQIGGAANINGGDFRGLQIGGALNLTRGDTHGLQIGGVNITGGKAHGFQVGVVNVATGEHAGIAAVGIYRGGYVYPEAEISDEGLLQAGIRHGAGAFYHSYGVGTQAFGRGEGQGPTLALSIRMGWRAELSEALEFALDAGATALISSGWRTPFSMFKLRPMLAVGLGERLALFGGPTLTLDLANESGNALPEGFIGGWMFGEQVQLRPGATVGVRVLTR
ncbi:carbohydrate-binding domain-containing protein [Lujinxingia vulgaris]|uniref:carbohydrate-binding domain-containing protein n=1 Tax=Lujinxingia vulgaris TaxID=2600176 RepID=UPI001E60A82E|nr:carbohydrate-binding domain-containing protein [Lujinxingia vulgaris]